MRKKIFGIVFILIGYLLLETVSWRGLLYLHKAYNLRYTPVDVLVDDNKKALADLLKNKMRYNIFSPELGWTIKENGEKSSYRANACGFRSSKEYSFVPPSNILRIACFGDSFTHGDDVQNDATWETWLENSSTNLEVLNFGVQGYGLDQAYLRYLKDGTAFQPHIVFIGYMTENISRNVNLFRPFYYPRTNIPLFKPRFVIRDGKLVLLPNPITQLSDYQELLNHPRKTLSRIGRNDYFYKNRYKSGPFDFSPFVRLIKMTINNVRSSSQYGIFQNSRYNKNSEALAVTTKLFDEFHQAALRNGSLPIILIFPRIQDVEVYRGTGEKLYAPLLAYLDAAGYDYIDCVEAFSNPDPKIDIDAWFVRGSHYTPYGNKFIADHISSYLYEQGLTNAQTAIQKTIP